MRDHRIGAKFIQSLIPIPQNAMLPGSRRRKGGFWYFVSALDCALIMKNPDD